MDAVIEGADSTNGEAIVEAVVEGSDSSIEALQIAPEGETAEQKNERLESLNKQLFARTMKAEGKELVDGKWVKKPKPAVVPAKVEEAAQAANLTPKDYLALTEAGVTSEDFDEVVRVSKILGKPITEALKDKTLKSILSERIEERKTANATHTRGGARGTPKLADADVLAKAEKGETVESAEGMQAIFRARRDRTLGNRK